MSREAGSGMFERACEMYRSSPEKFSDFERMELYALYKQATSGDAPSVVAALPMLVGASRAAWARYAGTSKSDAEARYAAMVSARLEPEAGKKTESYGRQASSVELASEMAADEALLTKPLEGMTRDEAIAVASMLRDRVRQLWAVGHVVKSGELTRFRETMTGGDWSARWFEVVPGWLRCYRSRTNRDLRLEVSLSRIAHVRRGDHVKSSRRFGTRFVLVVELASDGGLAPSTDAAKFSTLHELRLSTGTAEDRDEWIAAIATATRAVQETTTTTTRKTILTAEATTSVEESGGGQTRGGQEPPRDKEQDTSPSFPAAEKGLGPGKNEMPRDDDGSPRPGASILGRTKGPGHHFLRPVHRVARPSLLSSDATETQSFAGFVNCIAVVAIVANLRHLVHEWHTMPVLSFLVAGFQASGHDHGARASKAATSPPYEVVLGTLVLTACFAASFRAEKAASVDARLGPVADCVHAAVLLATLYAPVALISRAPARPVLHFAFLFEAVIAWMKHLSWCHTNAALRRLYFSSSSSAASAAASSSSPSSSQDDEYPGNLRARSLIEFHFLPTLVYQPSYPRARRVRVRWLAKRCVELGTCLTLILVLVTQFVVPTVVSWVADRSQRETKSVLFFVERLLALAVPSLAVWILVFYSLFELWLNILAEITRFGDRLFYKDWWNASRLDEYWRLWNIPVHRFLARHVYAPCLDYTRSKPLAMVLVFFFSAALHELLVSVPCHVVRFWAFGAMMSQIPLIYLTKLIYEYIPQKSRLGNYLFWVSFCIVGQPMCLMLYFRDAIANQTPHDHCPDPHDFLCAFTGGGDASTNAFLGGGAALGSSAAADL